MVELIERTCPVCGIAYGLPAAFYNARKDGSNNGSWHCPNGHSLSIVKSEAAKLKEQLEEERRKRQSAQQQIAYYQDQAEHEKRRANGYKGHATRITKRAKAGVCPCCNRTFKQLAQHMANKHPQFTPMELEDRPPEGATVQ